MGRYFEGSPAKTVSINLHKLKKPHSQATSQNQTPTLKLIIYNAWKLALHPFTQNIAGHLEVIRYSNNFYFASSLTFFPWVTHETFLIL